MKLKEIKPGMVIHCKTEQEAKKLLGILSEMNFKWCDRTGVGEDRTFFDEADECGLCYHVNDSMKLEYARYGYFASREEYGEITPFSSLIIEEKTYEDGLNEAWAAAKKIVLGKEHGGLPCEDLGKIFTSEDGWETEYSVLKNLTPQEAIAKLEAYEAEKQIKVWDVVEYFTAVSNPHFGIYLSETKDEHWVLTPYCEAPQSLEKKTGWQFKKTGKHIDISSILAEIGKE